MHSAMESWEMIRERCRPSPMRLVSLRIDTKVKWSRQHSLFNFRELNMFLRETKFVDGLQTLQWWLRSQLALSLWHWRKFSFSHVYLSEHAARPSLHWELQQELPIGHYSNLLIFLQDFWGQSWDQGMSDSGRLQQILLPKVFVHKIYSFRAGDADVLVLLKPSSLAIAS